MKMTNGVTAFPLAIIVFLSYKLGFNKGKLQGYKDRLYEEWNGANVYERNDEENHKNK